ncbi:MAG: hypothetical protein LBS99_03870, partial [Clostridiales bacterium]|nr:hypothetical protein [Clostridiales bacterium]
MEKVTNVVRRGKIKIILYMFLCAAIVTGPLLIFTTKAAVLMGVADLFNVPANVAIKPDAAAPFAMDAGKKGVLFESQTEGAAVSLSSPVSGLMDISLRVYSEEDYSGDVLYAKGDPYVNRYLDLSELKIRLTDRGSGRFFDIILCGGQRTSVTVVSARVESGSSLTGSYYTADGIAAHPISTKWNTRGMFTQLGGTSFCNRVLFNGQISSSTKPVRIIFDPVTKCVYGYNYGISAAIEQKRLIADLSDSADFRAADLFEDGFDEYDVSFIFSQINYGKTGRFVLYSVSGQSFSGNFLTDSAGPMISASYPYNYYEGKKLPVSKPYGYAFIDGKISNINVRAYNPSNAEISLNSAAGTPLPLGSAWQESSYFIPQTAGSYAIVYSASDSSGIVGTPVRVELDVKAGEPPVFYDINNGGYEQNVQIGLGGNITVNGAVAYSGITKRNVPLPVDATVKRGGYEVAIFSGASDNLFTPDAVGTYDIIYTVKDHAHILTSETYTFTVSSTVAGYQFDGVIKDFYIAGESLTLPQAVVVFNGITYSGIGIAYAPSGKKYTFLKFVPDEIGGYNVVYSAVISGAVHSKHISFTVKNGSASMVTANSSFVTLQAGAKAPDYLGSYSGLLMSGTTDGASVTYKNIIDVSTKSATDPLIEILPIPPQKGVKALDKYTVTLTDIYDSKNFVRIEVTSAWINPHAVVKAGAGTQALTGLWNNAPQTSRTGGYLSWHSFSGEGPVNDESMRLSMD